MKIDQKPKDIDRSSESSHESLTYYSVDPEILEGLDLPVLPAGYAYMGGAARAVALAVITGETSPIRDLDIVAVSDLDPDMSQAPELAESLMPDDYAYGNGIHSETIDQYFSSRDLTVNEVLVVDGNLILSKSAESDLRDKVIRPTGYEEGAYHGRVGPKMTIKMLLLEQVFQQTYGEGSIADGSIDVSDIDDFYIALGLNKALEYGREIALGFVKSLHDCRIIGEDSPTNPIHLAVQLRAFTDFIFRGFVQADRVNDHDGLSPINDLLDNNLVLDTFEEYEDYRYFGKIKNRQVRNGKRNLRPTDEI